MPPPPGLLRDPPMPFNEVTQRFEQRFASFHSSVTHPEPLSYADFASSTDVSSLGPIQLLQSATEALTMVNCFFSLPFCSVTMISHRDEGVVLNTLLLLFVG